MSPVNILIVDDREENIVALEALLKRDDIRIFSTTSPNEALKIAWDTHIAIALIDVQMPEMDGFELVEMLKSNPRTRDIMVIFVTAISKETKYAVKGLGTGAIDYLYKPLDPYITSAKVDSFVHLARTQAEIRLKNEELQNFAIVVKNSADIICSVDAQNLRISNINPAVETIMGFKSTELMGKGIVSLAVENQQTLFRKKLGEIIKDNLNFAVFELQFETFDKRVIWVECRASYHNKTIFLNISDISPQKSYQEQLIKSKENAEYSKKVKETFLANMSHELRTPVNGIIGITSLLLRTDLNEQQKNMLNLLETSSKSLLGVINDVLDISKMEAGKFNIVRTPNNVHEIIKAVFDLLKFRADESNIEFILEIEDNVPENLMVDSLRLNQILMNLLSNAIKFTERGYVKLKVSVLQKHGDKVKLKYSVEDSGIGIPADRLSKIFESFEQAEEDTVSRYGGTGLGLTIVKKLAELKGGELTVSSQLGKGSTFNFINWHTIAAKPVEKVSNKPDRVLSPFNNVCVLVAEDNMVNQFMLSKMLKDWNVEVEMVDNGRKLIEKLKTKRYDLILMDTHMPEMNGYETARTIRVDFEEPKRSVPIISLSASSFGHEQEQALTAGMNDVLAKPFQPYQLHEKMSQLLKVEA
ncbi:PAS domain S-box-containing protein [Mucilaginibacter lappiensis]|uniref:histidine kinase n=1 Tax=Mucilaginibacter lappiensis TaxID=354630 RepID=A0ABR6PGK7_9SPHI|nr:response regulator [Mucilaginibacter lappiensis]MBB6108895.1 PAS domain S-box-containing protein [Mucilaginibacter lappiensis]SIQ66881.1 PAS domain S-box-containing protein [Mucilaginibacter lappiensis]